MQEQKSAHHSLSDIFELERGSSSIGSGTDLALHWNNNLDDEESMGLPNYALPTNECNVVYPAPVQHNGNSLSIWSRGQPSSADQELQLQSSGVKNEAALVHPLSGNASPSFRLDEGSFELSNTLAIHQNDGIDISGPSVGFLTENENNRQNDSFNDRHLGLKRKASEGSSGESSCHENPGPAEGVENNNHGRRGPFPVEICVDPSQESLDQKNGIGMGRGAFAEAFMPESPERNTRLRTNPFYWQDSALSYNVWGPVSTQGTPTHQILSGYHPFNCTLNARSSTDDASSSQAPNLPIYRRSMPPYTVVGPLSSRIPTFSAGSSGSSRERSSASQVELSSRIASGGSPVNHMSQLENDVTDLTQEVSRWNRSNMDGSRSRNIASSSLASSGPSRVHSSPSSGWMSDQDSLEGRTRRLSARLNQTLSSSSSESGSEASRWNRSNMDGSGPRNIASSSLASSGPSRVQSTPSSGGISDQDSLEERTRRFSAFLNQTFSSSSSESGFENGDLPLIRTMGSTPPGQQMPLSSRGRHRYPHLRSRLPNDRQGPRSGIPGMPLTLGSSTTSLDWSRLTSQWKLLLVVHIFQSLKACYWREERPRKQVEVEYKWNFFGWSFGEGQIRNLILARARQADNFENMRLEDMIRSPSIFYGVRDLHDRHRDMRLDVDNMSYEELLALEERIGNVSTGLSEHTILKCLKQRKYVPVAAGDDQEVEPCCICRENYLESEELGTLDCGHDFHTACIKQWLMLKNLCPICKTTGLVP